MPSLKCCAWSVFGPGEPEVELGRPDARRGDRHGDRQPLMRVEPHRSAKRVGVRRQRPVDVEVERVVARVALDIVDLDMHLRTGRRRRGSAAGSPRRRSGRAPRRPPAAEPTLSFDQATAASRTEPLNAGRSKVTVALPSSSSFTTPEKSASGGWVGRLPSRLPPVSPPVWMAPAAPCMPSISMPQRSRISTGKLALAEEIGARVRRLEAGEVENADVDRRHRHPRLLARREARDLDRQRHRLARLRERRRVERNARACARLPRSRTRRGRSPGRACAARRRRAAGGSARPHRRPGPSRRRP